MHGEQQYPPYSSIAPARTCQQSDHTVGPQRCLRYVCELLACFYILHDSLFHAAEMFVPFFEHGLQAIWHSRRHIDMLWLTFRLYKRVTSSICTCLLLEGMDHQVEIVSDMPAGRVTIVEQSHKDVHNICFNCKACPATCLFPPETSVP